MQTKYQGILGVNSSKKELESAKQSSLGYAYSHSCAEL